MRYVQWCSACGWEQPTLPLVKFMGETIEPDRGVVEALTGEKIPPAENWCPRCKYRPLSFIDKGAS